MFDEESTKNAIKERFSDQVEFARNQYIANTDVLYDFNNRRNIADINLDCMARAIVQVTDDRILLRCKTLTDSDIYPNVLKDARIIQDCIRCCDPMYEELVETAFIYTTKAFIEYMISRCYELIVVSYPSTKATLVQFMNAMKSLEWYGREKLVLSLIVEIKKKLLLTSISTKQILNSYANVVESLTFFDPSCVLVHRVCDVIRDYVITRTDTIKTIIKFITNERPGENSTSYCSLIFSQNQKLASNDEYVLAIEETAKDNWTEWMPDPHDANPFESRLHRQSADVFSMLVMIYGSKEMFVKEYHEFLAARLALNGWRRRFREELSYVDMMKNRFHQGELTACEVMLKDIEDSESFCKKMSNLDVKIISKEYWPHQDDKSLTLPENFEELRKNVDQLYEITRKNTRKLRWFNSYGALIDLNLQIDEFYVNVEIPMPFYLVITAFIEKEQNSIAELMTDLKMEKKAVTEIVDWWIQQGCLKNDGNLITLNEDPEGWKNLQKYAEEQQRKAVEKGDCEDDDEDEEDEYDDEGSNPRIEYMESYWEYSKNMLKISSRQHPGQFVQPVTDERLLSIFRMLASPGKPPITLEEVHMFMNRKIRANMVFVENGIYKLTLEYLAKLDAGN